MDKYDKANIENQKYMSENKQKVKDIAPPKWPHRAADTGRVGASWGVILSFFRVILKLNLFNINSRQNTNVQECKTWTNMTNKYREQQMDVKKQIKN